MIVIMRLPFGAAKCLGFLHTFMAIQSLISTFRTFFSVNSTSKASYLNLLKFKLDIYLFLVFLNCRIKLFFFRFHIPILI